MEARVSEICTKMAQLNQHALEKTEENEKRKRGNAGTNIVRLVLKLLHITLQYYQIYALSAAASCTGTFLCRYSLKAINFPDIRVIPFHFVLTAVLNTDEPRFSPTQNDGCYKLSG